MIASEHDDDGVFGHDHEETELRSSSVLSSTLELKGKTVQVYLSSGSKCVCWHPHNTDDAGVHVAKSAINDVPVEDIFAVTYESLTGKKRRSKNIELLPGTVFCIHYVKREKGHRWKDKKLLFHCNDTEECQLWVTTLNDALQGFERPKRLLIFVNPVGGKKLAKKVFTEKVALLFEIAGIKQDVVITERAKHAEDYILSSDVDNYDGIVSVGGDGMFSEILNGLLMRESKRTENGDSMVLSPKRPQIRLGIIPAGSTDTVVFCTTGTNDPVTSALQIIVGDSLPLDVCSVWRGQNIARYCVSLMGYGFFGDVIKSSEKLRWMGPRRYDMAGFMKFMVNRSYRGEVSYLPASAEHSDPKQFIPCRAGCKKCNSSFDETDYPKTSWKTARGKFISVIGANITCRCAKSPNGISPGAHVGDGYIDLILVRNTSRGQYLRHMIQLANRGDPFDFNFVEIYRVKEFKYRPIFSDSDEVEELDNCHDVRIDNLDAEQVTETNPLGSESGRLRQTSLWNIDGELLEDPQVQVKAHRQLVTLFARGIEDEERTASCTPCQRKL